MSKKKSVALVVACLIAQNLYHPALAVEEKKAWHKRIGSALRVDKAFKGVASFYAGKFHGRKTASGDIYNQNEMTCAHRTLPFGTKLKVTNPDTGKSCEVTVTDRGPFKKNRVLDLSKAAASKLGITGLAKVFYKPKSQVAEAESPAVH